ncbi:MAG: sigma-70 family RNA polymerase sigma factor [Planctomycetota bacterium]
MQVHDSRPADAVQLTDALVQRHGGAVRRHLRFLGAPPPVADDLTQETFLVLLRRPPRDLGEAALGAWLRATARNLFLAARRSPRPGLDLGDEDALDAAWLRLEGDDDGAARTAALRACLETLTARERDLLALRYGDEAGRATIAVRLGLSVEGVKAMWRRVKARLRACVERRMGHAE